MHPPSVATLREGQRCRALGGRIPMDWVATFLRIAWKLCRALGGNFPADWVAEFRGIRIDRPEGLDRRPIALREHHWQYAQPPRLPYAARAKGQAGQTCARN